MEQLGSLFLTLSKMYITVLNLTTQGLMSPDLSIIMIPLGILTVIIIPNFIKPEHFDMINVPQYNSITPGNLIINRVNLGYRRPDNKIPNNRALAFNHELIVNLNISEMFGCGLPDVLQLLHQPPASRHLQLDLQNSNLSTQSISVDSNFRRFFRRLI